MPEETVFRPPRRWGLVIHAAAIAAFGAAGSLGLERAASAGAGLIFLLYLIPALLAVIFIPILSYRAYALWGANYILERDGITLHWGFRSEAIPMNVIIWLHPAAGLDQRIPLPWVRWPGGILGERRLPDSTSIEFMAATAEQMILIATPGRVFAISPADSDGFLRTFQRLTELGTLSPIPPRSIRPAALLSRFWADLPARLLLLGGLIPTIGLLVWVSLTIPTLTQISLRFTLEGAPSEPVPAVRLMLLPVLNTFIFLADLLLGLFFYRRTEAQPLAYLLWGSSILTALLFIAAVIFILSAG